MGAVDHDRAIRGLADVLDEEHPAISEAIDHMTVVYDLVVDADRLFGADLEQLVDDVDRHVHTGTETTRIGKDDFHSKIIPSRGPQVR